MLDMLDAGVPSASDMPPGYPVRERAAALTLPVLALTAETDPLRSAHEPLLGLLQRGVAHVFPGAHPLQRPDQAGSMFASSPGGWRRSETPRLDGRSC
jgi:hypothetical protein